MRTVQYKVLDVDSAYALIDTFTSAIEANQYAMQWARANSRKVQVIKVTTELCKAYDPQEAN